MIIDTEAICTSRLGCWQDYCGCCSKVWVPERQNCIGMYHEPYQEACQGLSRGGSFRRASLLGSISLQGWPRKMLAGVCSPKPGEEPVQQRAKTKPHCHCRKSSLRSALDVLETTSSLGLVAGCHIRAAPGGSTGGTLATTLNSGRGSNVVRSLVQLITSTSLAPNLMAVPSSREIGPPPQTMRCDEKSDQSAQEHPW